MGIEATLRNGIGPVQIEQGIAMLKWALIFFVISLIAGFFGFTGLASGAALLAKILFYLALALFLVLLAVGLTMLA